MNTANSRRWALGTALLVSGALLTGWLVLPSGRSPSEAGVVRLADRAGAPAASPSEAPRPTGAEATRAPPSPQRNSELADDSQYLVVREPRDSGWADRSEAALLAFMRTIPAIDRRALVAKCSTSMCEVSGLADEDPATGSMGPTWAAMERETAAEALGRQGLERTATTLGTGRVREAFAIYYRRIASPNAQ
ncbi:hypothetical protein HZY97_08360 [Sphingomonas sp. R-74633]|uniref:hypothetical protein n=1 Tax=Sphingomonas sp. R-74633 TaxID=2751188 RepID=UPI0015D3D17F|nr:hypothetical protein [Sphingomonas sp. R-74633]NYT40766.1 hypothetical protein [Sphingomonas sp. R-74633]